MEVAEAFALISRAVDSGRPAHGYLVSGDIEKGRALAGMVLGKLFPGDGRLLDAHSHPDVIYLECEGKGRVITVDAVRERLVEPMSASSFSGGWKVGVVVGADRMRREAANAFLKTLEEPPPQTLFLLLTDSPDSILPTVLSRSQRIDLPLSDGVLEGDDYEAVSEAFAARDVAALAGKLAEFKAEDDETAARLRKSFYRTIMSFARRLMLGGRLPAYKAYRNIEAVEEAYRQSERNLSDEAVLSFMLDRMVFP